MANAPTTTRYRIGHPNRLAYPVWGPLHHGVSASRDLNL